MNTFTKPNNPFDRNGVKKDRLAIVCEKVPQKLVPPHPKKTRVAFWNMRGWSPEKWKMMVEILPDVAILNEINMLKEHELDERFT